MSLLLSLRSEIIKTRKTAPLYFTIAAAAFAPLMSILELFLDDADDYSKVNAFNFWLIRKFEMTMLLSLPLFLILVCTLLPQIEYKNNTWKQVLTSPQSKANVFVAKLMNVQLLILIFFITNTLVMFLGPVILHFKEPSLNILNQPLNGYKLLMSRVNIYVAVLAIFSIQFWLGIKFKNFIIPVGIGIALWFAGTILVMQNLELAAYFPYSYHAYGKFPNYNPLDNTAGWAYLIYAVVFLIIGFLDFNRRRNMA
jgi:hypothetical protein